MKVNTQFIPLIADRDSVCMADDIESHRKIFEVDENIKMIDLIKDLEEKEIEFKAYGGSIWAGNSK